MTAKTIDISKPQGMVTGPKISPVKRVSPEKTPPEKKTSPPPSSPLLEKSFVPVFLAIAANDIRCRLGLAAGPLPELQKKIEDTEKYNAFCRLARGER